MLFATVWPIAGKHFRLSKTARLTPSLTVESLNQFRFVDLPTKLVLASHCHLPYFDVLSKDYNQPNGRLLNAIPSGSK